MIKGNPFLSENFSSIWEEHFNEGKMGRVFKSIYPLRFVRHGLLPILSNSGGTLTKGIDYQLDENATDILGENILLIYDVPTYFEIVTGRRQKNLGFYCAKQYPGYLIDLEEYKDIAHFMSSTFSKSSRYKLNKYKRRLEECFDIEYRMWCGDMSKDEYDRLFYQFRKLLEKRFDDKGTVNNNLDTEEWNFYYDVAYPMIVEKQAALFVIYDSGVPIGITLNYFSDTVVFDAITVFDIDYSKFHLGSVTIMKLIEWSIENKYRKLDFSKGFFEYKTRWANSTYDFEYHIYYDSTSFKAKLLANGLKKFFDLKQLMRDKKLNEKLHRLRYRLRRDTSQEVSYSKYTLTEMDCNFDFVGLETVDLKTNENTFLKPIAFEFLYLNNECIKNLKIFKSEGEDIEYMFRGISKNMGLSFSKRPN